MCMVTSPYHVLMFVSKAPHVRGFSVDYVHLICVEGDVSPLGCDLS